MILKNEGGKLELRNDKGSFIRTIASKDVVDADLNSNETLIVITYSNGKVELRKDSGSFIRTILPSKAKKARWSGDEIAITLENGKTELRKESGSFIRTI